jgi:hypothetical protein
MINPIPATDGACTSVGGIAIWPDVMQGENYWIIGPLDQVRRRNPIFYAFAKSDGYDCPEDMDTTWKYFDPKVSAIGTVGGSFQHAGESLVVTCT